MSTHVSCRYMKQREGSLWIDRWQRNKFLTKFSFVAAMYKNLIWIYISYSCQIFLYFSCVCHIQPFSVSCSYAMDLKPGTYLIAPNIKNVSCTHARYTQPLYYYIGPFDVVQALIILMLTIGIIGANLMLIFVINHRRYSPYIHPQVC